MSTKSTKIRKVVGWEKYLTPAGMSLLTDVHQIILQARERVARAGDSGLTLLYWNVYVRIRKDVLKEKRAEYGAEIVAALLRQLTLRVP